MSNVLVNPQNGYEINVNGIDNPGRFLCVVLFGPLWFIVNGMWAWALVWLFVVGPIAILTLGVGWIIAAFFANGIYKKYLLKNGWITKEVYNYRNSKGAKYGHCY